MTDQRRFFSNGLPLLRALAAAVAVMLMLPAGTAEAIPMARAPALSLDSPLIEVQYAQRRPAHRRRPVRRARNGNGNALAAVAIGAMVLGVTAAIVSDRRRERRERRARHYGYGYQPYSMHETYQPAYRAGPAYYPAPVNRARPVRHSRPVYHSRRSYPGQPVVRHRAQRSPFAAPREPGHRHGDRRRWRQY